MKPNKTNLLHCSHYSSTSVINNKDNNCNETSSDLFLWKSRQG